MDVVTLGAAKADAKKNYSYKSLRLASWHRTVTEETVNTNVLVVGDSTGASTTRWPRLIADKIAAAWPRQTVVYKGWDDPTKTYPAGQTVTVQTGSGPRTITVYNGSLSGSVIGYARDNLGTLTSGFTPDVIFVNFGHNSPQLADDYRAIHQETVQILSNTWPNAAIILMTQNPRAVTDAAYADDQGKQKAIYQLAVASGHDIVDINEVFRLYGNYAADLLLPDGLHPNDTAGSPLWANKIWDAIKPSRIPLPSGYQPVATRIWVPATAFTANTGTPALVQHFGLPAWELDASTPESVSALVDIPSHWDKQNIKAIWTTEGTTAQGVVWTGDHMYAGSVAGGGGSVNLGTWSLNSGGATSTSSTTAGRTVSSDLWQRTGLGQSPLGIRIGRNASHASDTLTIDALFLGLIIERAY